MSFWNSLKSAGEEEHLRHLYLEWDRCQKKEWQKRLRSRLVWSLFVHRICFIWRKSLRCYRRRRLRLSGRYIRTGNISWKNKDKNKTDKLDDLYQNAKGKLSKMYKLLMANAAFMMFLQTNPIMQQILLSITNFNYDLDMTSRILGMKKEEVISNLNVLTNVCYGYISDMNKEKTTEFEDSNEKTVGRRY